jgi:hypothetical protein
MAMYRDAKTELDERDRAVGAILIGESLIASCESARKVGNTDPSHAWRAIRDAHDDFPEIWRCLDRARNELARRGVNTAGYDEMRPHVRTRLATGVEQLDDDVIMRVDPAALDDARRATDELKLAVPGADWIEIERRTSGLVHAPRADRRRRRLVLAGVSTLAAGFGVVMLVLLVGLASTPRVDRGQPRSDSMRRQLAEIAEQRPAKIDELRRSLGERCDPPLAHELVKQLAMDGRGAEMRQLATEYTARCGEDVVISNWSRAPLH